MWIWRKKPNKLILTFIELYLPHINCKMALITISNVFYLKTFLFTFTFFLFALGSLVFVLGLSSYGSFNFLADQLFTTEYSSASVLIMTISMVVIIISAFGCVAAFLENKLLLRFFNTILIAAMIGQILGTGFVYAYRNKVSGTSVFCLQSCLNVFYHCRLRVLSPIVFINLSITTTRSTCKTLTIS